jgi:hypothetical protein
MVLIKSQKNTLGVIFIDGYVPTVDDLKFRFRKLAEEYKIPRTRFADEMYYYIYRNKKFSENMRLNFFRGMVWKLNRIFCPHKYKISRKDVTHDTNDFTTPCFHRMIGLEQKINNYLNIPPSDYRNRNIESALNIIRDEYVYEKETKHHHSGYLQNIIYYRIDNEFNCNSAEHCCKNWIDKLTFRVKEQNEYKNISLFEAAWRKLIHRELQCQFVEPNRDFLILYYKLYLSAGYT